MSQLEIKNLHVSIDGKEILKGLDLTVEQGKVHAIMGPNGTGKSTLAYTLMGHPNYTVTEGEVHFKGQNVLELEPDERSRLGIFLAFQYPVAIPGVTVANFCAPPSMPGAARRTRRIKAFPSLSSANCSKSR